MKGMKTNFPIDNSKGHKMIELQTANKCVKICLASLEIKNTKH